jgi:hypothetical protein
VGQRGHGMSRGLCVREVRWDKAGTGHGVSRGLCFVR